jgi:hypothetical protein
VNPRVGSEMSRSKEKIDGSDYHVGERCRGLVHRVPCAIGYDQKNLDTAWFPSAANG